MVATVATPLNTATNGTNESPSPLVRETVRDLLLSSAAYHSLAPEKRYEIAKAMVSVCQTAVSLLTEEAKTSGMVAELAQPLEYEEPKSAPPATQPTVAMAQNAGDQFSGVSAQRVAGTTRAGGTQQTTGNTPANRTPPPAGTNPAGGTQQTTATTPANPAGGTQQTTATTPSGANPPPPAPPPSGGTPR